MCNKSIKKSILQTSCIHICLFYLFFFFLLFLWVSRKYNVLYKDFLKWLLQYILYIIFWYTFIFVHVLNIKTHPQSKSQHLWNQNLQWIPFFTILNINSQNLRIYRFVKTWEFINTRNRTIRGNLKKTPNNSDLCLLLINWLI